MLRTTQIDKKEYLTFFYIISDVSVSAANAKSWCESIWHNIGIME
jgi:hypothetical protein